MDNHIHLVVQTPEPNLGRGMQWFHGHYGRYFNDRHGRIGHLFERRYGAVRQKTDEQLKGALRYVALNPVEAGMCAEPAQYPWSSDRWMRQGVTSDLLDVDQTLAFMGTNDAATARRAYIDLTTP
jgi:hypothetical protein